MNRDRTNIVQGEFAVASEAEANITTLLGSCVATCIFDFEVQVGGMNHFLLPGDVADSNPNGRYGVHLMELLINGLMRSGARRNRLQAKIFGGARTVRGLSDIGSRNIAFAREFLARESIPIVGESVGGQSGRRIEFWPANGRVRQILIREVPQEVAVPTFKPSGDRNAGELDLF
ncbi:MAG: chemotaxis protein CheD [Proteobacteria bacterium]|nr:chemotaxis protein CheD [Pseudomonadota bacterium]